MDEGLRLRHPALIDRHLAAVDRDLCRRLSGLAVTCGIGFLAACTGPATSVYSPSLDPSDAIRLDAGDHRISSVFGYSVEGGFLSGRRVLIYHVADPTGGATKEFLASTAVGYLGNRYYRPAMFAVSDDGQTLLYRHQAGESAPRSLASKPAGVYEYVHGRGDLLLHPDADVVEAGPLPKNAMIFSIPAYEGSLWEGGEHYIRTTDGEEYPERVHGGNALHKAAYLGQTTRLLDLLQTGVDLETRDARGFTPLHEAVWAGKLETVQALLDHGADTAAVAPELEWTPLQEAARFGRDDIVDALLAKGVDVNERNAHGQSPYDLAKKYGQSETAKHLLERGAQKPPGVP